ncbi:cytochrome c biogenesis protein [Alicyclobacillus cellulosilyticus]|uniref:Cytochrome c biogenesis protein n=1 Tax=Alicyclobacillus cellulosilyticus TaxID=1003997 RepID=A0A917KF13_9BACL|nr:sugar ABC transporter permease [Alicyclobacillus cellulosilyticus]GGJ11706.1 cytochrome c biogenesis protein [Alicyclobacillus cellulosilyticus]
MSVAMAGTQSTQRPKTSGTWRNIRRNWSLYLFISPFYILFFVFGLFPIIFSLVLSFESWDGLDTPRFIGLKNFALLMTDSQFWQSVGNTFIIWVESTIPMLFLALIIAFLLNSAFVKLREFWRFTFFLPNITSVVAEAVLFGAVFAPKFGLLNWVIERFGSPPVDWLDNNFWLQVAIAIMIIWRWTGYNAIIYLAGLQAIPEELYEAARIDGASLTQSFFRITIPLMRPIILFTVIMSTIGGMQIFTEPFVLTGGSGGPGQGGMTMVLYLYNQAFGSHLFGYSSAIGWVLFLIILVFSLFNSILVRRLGTA